MNISQKFATSSILILGIFSTIIIGNGVVVERIKNTVQEQSDLTTETIKVSLEAENTLKSEILILKDIVLFDNNKSQLITYQNKFITTLNKLEALMPNDPGINIIRRRHKFLQNMANELTDKEKKEFTILTSQQYFLAINSFDRDIDFIINGLIEKAYQQRELMQQELNTLYQLQGIITIIVIIITISLFTVTFIFVWQPVIKSLKQLQLGTSEIANGNFDYRLNILTGDELEKLSQAFNYMASKLLESRNTLLKNNELTTMNEILASEITERKQAEIALQKALKQLQNTQLQLIQTEKMSSLGQLVAGIAHEINNPVNFIHGNIIHTSEYTQDILELIALYQEELIEPSPVIQEKIEEIDLEFILEDLPKVVHSMQMGSNRIRDIILSLRTFSRLDEAEMKEVDIHEGINSTLLILQNRLKAKPDHPEIEIIKNYANLPPIGCYAGQLNQVFMNIINNAIDVLDHYNEQRSLIEIENTPSTITITTQLIDNNQIQIKIADNGPGISEDIKNRLFDPFFTTKPIGKGTGLGLSISYEIVVNKHSGILECNSEIGKGTEFLIQIPLFQSDIINLPD